MEAILESNRKNILIVDDVTENIDILRSILSDKYEISAAKNGEQTLKLIKQGILPDLILLDVMLPDFDGYSICELLKRSFTTRNIPIIFVTAKENELDEKKGFEVGAVDYITKPIRPSVVLARVKTHLSLSNQKQHLEDLVKERTLELDDTRLKIIRKLGKAAEFKDNETGLHVIRMSKYAQLIGQSLGLSKNETELILHVVPMHDIGKIGIPDKILLKPGQLDTNEWEIMKTHTQIGANILEDETTEILREARDCALSHHEKWDGSGYPRGLKGKEIPLFGRIAAISDVFDALTSKRPYKEAWTIEKTINYMRSQRGIHFQPKAFDAFIKVLPEIKTIMEKHQD